MQNPMIFVNFNIQCPEVITTRTRKNNAYCEVLPWTYPTTFIPSKNPVGIVLSGGPSSVYEALVFRQPSSSC